jgi:hypothetical protein
LPHERFLPNSNQVGIERGGAAYLDLSSAERAAVGAGMNLEARIYQNSFLRQENRSNLTCRELAEKPFLVEGTDFWRVRVPDGLFAAGPQILALEGCSGLAELVQPFRACKTNVKATDQGGTLELLVVPVLTGSDARGKDAGPARFSVKAVNLMLEAAPTLRFLRDMQKTEIAVEPVGALTSPLVELEGETAFVARDYERFAFELSVAGNKAVRTTMLETQQRFAPNMLPAEFYTPAVPHVLVIVGDPSPNRTGGHLLSIPLIDPEAIIETDAGAPDSGGGSALDGGALDGGARDGGALDGAVRDAR